MEENQWVQHISGAGKKWEVHTEMSGVWHVYSGERQANSPAYYNLPKCDYRPCSPPERGASLHEAIRHLDQVQAELTIHPKDCPEPWRAWMVEAHNAMCEVVRSYKEDSGWITTSLQNG